MGDDGFWIDAEGVAPGTMMTCKYSAGGNVQEIKVRYEPQPGGQFIYTGMRPTTVSVVMAGVAAAAPILGIESMMDSEDDRRRELERRRQQEEEERRRRRRFDPSAY
jgi:hypothetical protein